MRARAVVTLALSILVPSLSSYCQIQEHFEYTGIDGSPGRWPKPHEMMPCCSGPWPKTGVFNITGQSPLDHPLFGYPLRGSLFVGLNDTFQISVPIANRSGVDFPMAAHSPQTWFIPRVYRPGMEASDASLWRDSADLGYRMRAWYSVGSKGLRKTTAPGKILPGADGDIAMFFDVWQLPEGVWCLCIDTTAAIPASFTGVPYGYTFEYREPLNLADSTNAFESCFWRMACDTNFVAALNWTSQILSINPNSVPGWRLRGYFYTECDPDTQLAIEAYDKALVALNDGLDPAMPDSTERTLFEAEYDYVLWCKQSIEYYRSLLGP